jgi:hypothetical protein
VHGGDRRRALPRGPARGTLITADPEEQDLPLAARVTDAFEPTLARYTVDDLERHAGTIIGLSPELRLSYLNPAWFRFARANGGEPRISLEWPLGRSIVESWDVPYRGFYEPHYRAALATQTVWTHEYDCSTPSAHRSFHQIVYAVPAGLLVVHSLAVTLADEDDRRSTGPVAAATYVDAHGIITQCMHCRPGRRPGATERWDWIPEWTTAFPVATSHGLCETCFRFYYPAA